MGNKMGIVLFNAIHITIQTKIETTSRSSLRYSFFSFKLKTWSLEAFVKSPGFLTSGCESGQQRRQRDSFNLFGIILEFRT
jgi:hypothetical protein